MLSPVMGAWFTVDSPALTTPSSGSRSPGRIRMTSSTLTLEVSASAQLPEDVRTLAMSGARSSNKRIALRARSRERDSISSAIENRKMTIAASGHWPMAAAPITARVMRKWMLSARVFSAIHPRFSVSSPPAAIDRRASSTTANPFSLPVVQASTSAPIAATPEIASIVHRRRETPVTAPRDGVTALLTVVSRSSGASMSRIACSVVSCVTVTSRAIRSKRRPDTADTDANFARMSCSSAGQSILATTNTDSATWMLLVPVCEGLHSGLNRGMLKS